MLCTDNVIHAYRHPLIACLFDWFHGKYMYLRSFRLWKCEGDIEVVSADGKVGCSRLTTIEEVDFPEYRTGHYQDQKFRARLDLADLPHRECGFDYLCRCRGLSLHSRVRNGSFQGDHHFSRDHPFLGFQLGHIEPALRVVCHLSA